MLDELLNPLDEEALQQAYGTVTDYTRGLLQKLGILPAIDATTQIDPAYMTALSGLVGPSPTAPLQALRPRLQGLMESPLYFQTPLKQRLGLMRGQPSGGGLTSEQIAQIHKANAYGRRLADLADKAGRVMKPIGASHGATPHGWQDKLIQGGRR